MRCGGGHVRFLFHTKKQTFCKGPLKKHSSKVFLSNDGHSRGKLGLSNIQMYLSVTRGWWFSPGTPVSSTNKTDRHDITEILLKVALNPHF